MGKRTEKVVAFLKKMNERVRRTSFGNRIVSIYEGVGTPGMTAEMRSVSPVAHPLKFRDEVAGKGTGRVGNASGPNPTAQAIRWRVVNGPEVNILLCGVPFLIDFAVTAAVEQVTKKRDAKRRRKVAARGTAPVRLKVAPAKDQRLKLKKKDVGNVTLPPAPYSDQALSNLYTGLIDAGMSDEGAKQIATGGLEGLEATEHLSMADTDALMNYLLSDMVRAADAD